MAEKSQREMMIERLIYFAIMTALANWGSFTTDVAIEQTQRVDVKQEQVTMADRQREKMSDSFQEYIEYVMLQRGCEP